MKTKKLYVCYMIILVALILTGCVKMDNTQQVVYESEMVETSTYKSEPESKNNSGGYEIHTSNIHCMVLVDNAYKYSRLEEFSSNRIVEFYVGPTELILIDRQDGLARYYIEEFEYSQQIYEDPLKTLFEEFSDLNFVKSDLSEDELDVYEAVKTVETIQSEHIRYNLYTLSMTWIDGKEYCFNYYDYFNGSTLITAEAPSEMNPRVYEDTQWVMDIDNLCVYNAETNEQIKLELVSCTEGEGISPDGEGNTTILSEIFIRVYTDKGTEDVVKLWYGSGENGVEIQVLDDVYIEKPVITEDMLQMDTSTAEETMMLIYMIESLI